MAALDSAERSARALLRFPVVFVGAAAFGLLKLPVEVTRPLRISLDVYAVLALVTFAFTPVLLAGLYALAASALAGRGAPGSFWEGVGDGYLNLLVANLLYAVVQHLLMLVFTVVVLGVFFLVAGGLGAVAESLSDPSRARETAAAAGLLSLVGVVGISVTYLLVRFTVAFFAQLYKPAVVVGGAGPVEAFVESARLVRANGETVLAFVLVRLFVMVLLALPGLAAAVGVLAVESAVFGELASASAAVVLAPLAVVAFFVGVVELAFLATYRVAFYEALTDGSPA